MHVIINEQRIPDNTLQVVLLSMGGGVHVRGEVIKEDQRIVVDDILRSLHEGEAIEFDVEDKDYHRFTGAGRVQKVDVKEETIDRLVRIKFSINIQYVH